MTKIIYEIVEHDGGWAYRVDGVYSETFRSHDAAKAAATRAARRVAAEQRVPGGSEEILYEDEKGVWRTEHADGHDRPDTDVVG